MRKEPITLEYILLELGKKYPLLSDDTKKAIAQTILNDLRSDVYRVGLVRNISARIADDLTKGTNKSMVQLYNDIVINIEYFFLHFKFSSVI